MKKIEVNTHSDRIELECGLSELIFQFLIDKGYYKEFDLVTIAKDEVYNTELGQEIEADIYRFIGHYIKVKEE